MGARAIQRLRIKIIAIMLAAFFVAMLLIAVLVNGAHIVLAQSRMDRVLDAIIQGGGVIEEPVDGRSLVESQRVLRYLLVTVDADGRLSSLVGGYDEDMDVQKAQELAQAVIPSLLRSGSIGDYYYKVAEADGGGHVVAFVDGSVELGEGREVLSLTLDFLAAGLLLSFVIVWFLSRRAIQPELEAARRQSEFVTNASHELKTPLAVIRANTEILEALGGEGEWTSSTLRQVDYLDGLVRDLVDTARADEWADSQELCEVDVSAAAREALEPFESVAQRRGVSLASELEPGVMALADVERVVQLVRLLVDNACKYCDEGGSIQVSVSPVRRAALSGRRRRGARIVVSNSFARGEGHDWSRLFERFYRADEAHSNQQGYGIGLSIAQRICEQYEGGIRAGWKDGVVSLSAVIF
ncbi:MULTISPECIES: sensor histidine kinase [Olsenella]|uniref:sensor histidine kinase n=1 Tax=Olsenella TaxID=133925 RepID=UPI000783AFF9|nr:MULTISPECIES: HAMP domain-containing sensor histidine kinase [Olsenella]KXB61537.1 histidine kinase A domain protein [Olsenella sp. DNF00959]